MGKVLLAFLPGPQLDEILSEVDYKRHTARTIRSKTALTNELREVRKRGYAVSNEENERAAIEVAVPVLDRAGRVTAAVGVLTNTKTVPMETLVADARPHLEAAADSISAALGYKSTSNEDR
jgi:IclR family KDG regulon transcriptional repressor